MKIILLQEVEKLGRAGEQVEVADGYARNFLIPARKAVAATPAHAKSLNDLVRQNKGRQDRLRQAAEELAGRITGARCVVKRRAGEQEKLFGSVTNLDIAAALADLGIEVDRRKILLDEPIKALGNYTVQVRLHPQVVADLRLNVERREE
ncbi:MAG: 50S ribosomal protein L9 [Candidatus Methylomirabilaceae bacterium]